jgi:hypothetical protein
MFLQKLPNAHFVSPSRLATVTREYDAIFCYPILFAICTSTFKNCAKIYTMACKRELSTPLLYLMGTKPVGACGKETYRLNLKD